jgi:putative NIF3 family GTP cyclohydrolase 1 type 2
MPMKRDRIVEYLTTYLGADGFTDYCVNGLQVAGAEEVDRVVAGVSISRRLIEVAIRLGAQMILVHHGFFRGDIPDPLRLAGIMKERLALLLRHDISVVGFHLPLDAHPEIGNNALACKYLGLTDLHPVDIGFVGQLASPVNFAAFVELVEAMYERKVQAFAYGPETTRRVAVISGGICARLTRCARGFC